jgi:branched-subunit amino acid aminotransferase/4-amino-4-deoxychorismate lyase
MDAFAASSTTGRRLTGPKPPLALFETMRWEHGELRRWERHLARLTASAAALGVPLDPVAAAEAIASAVASAVAVSDTADRARIAQGDDAPQGPLRVRLELRADGVIDVDARPHPDTAPATSAATAHAEPIVVWSSAPIRAADPARRHKTTDRALYDAATAWAAGAGVADVLFLNEHGRVAEGAISNVFLLGSDGRWRTPPMADGALPGVLRAELIERGQAVEAPLSPHDLLAGTLAIGNALRGLRTVRLAGTPVWSPDLVQEAPTAHEPGGSP